MNNLKWIALTAITALGAGAFFIPNTVNVASAGFSTILIAFALALPLSILSHLLLINLINKTNKKTVHEAISITSPILAKIHKWLCATLFLFIAALNFLMAVNETSHMIGGDYRVIISIIFALCAYAMIKNGVDFIGKFIAVPVVIIIISSSIYLIKYWSPNIELSLSGDISIEKIIDCVLIVLFAMNFSPLVPELSNNNGSKSYKLAIIGCCLIAITLLVFTVSSSMVVGSVNDAINLGVLTRISMITNDHLVMFFGGFGVVAASIGAMIGTLIGFQYNVSLNKKKSNILSITVVAIIGIINPSIISMIKLLIAPMIIATSLAIPIMTLLLEQYKKDVIEKSFK